MTAATLAGAGHRGNLAVPALFLRGGRHVRLLCHRRATVEFLSTGRGWTRGASGAGPAALGGMGWRISFHVARIHLIAHSEPAGGCAGCDLRECWIWKKPCIFFRARILLICIKSQEGLCQSDTSLW